MIKNGDILKKRIVAIMDNNGYSFEVLANKLGYNPATFKRYMTGGLKDMPQACFDKLHAYLKEQGFSLYDNAPAGGEDPDYFPEDFKIVLTLPQRYSNTLWNMLNYFFEYHSEEYEEYFVNELKEIHEVLDKALDGPIEE